MSNVIQPGSKVRLNVPENIRLHGAEAVVSVMESWGAHVLTSAAGSGRFRALWDEMIMLPPNLDEAETVHDLVLPVSNGSTRVNGSSVRAARSQARDSGYTGDCCEHCGSFKMKRNGSCLLCEDCQLSSGCS